MNMQVDTKGAGDNLPGSLYTQADGPAQYFPPPGAYAQPVMAQPVTGSGYPSQSPDSGDIWAQKSGDAKIPTGLHYLSTIDQLLVIQKIEPFEEILSLEMRNKYIVQNKMGQGIYTAREESGCCARNCAGELRAFDMKIEDVVGNEVIHLQRPCACACCLCPCCLQTMEVMAPPGVLAGKIFQEWSFLTPKFRILNSNDEIELRIEGPVCACSICGGDVEFHVLSPSGNSEVGKITKKWSGIMREMFTDADNFGISFPMNLDVNMKAVMLGACFLIDFMYFEKPPNQKRHNPSHY